MMYLEKISPHRLLKRLTPAPYFHPLFKGRAKTIHGKFYFCLQWFIQVFHAALVPYIISKNCLTDIEAITFSSTSEGQKRYSNFFLS